MLSALLPNAGPAPGMAGPPPSAPGPAPAALAAAMAPPPGVVAPPPSQPPPQPQPPASDSSCDEASDEPCDEPCSQGQATPERTAPASVVAAMSTSIDEKSVRAAYEDVRSDTSDTEWAVFKFQDQRIVCEATGAGFDAFRGHFADNERGFGFIRFQMGDEMSKRQKFVFLTWVGPQVSVIRRAKMSIDKAMVKNIVKNFAVELQVESQSEINVESLRDQLTRVGGASY